MDLHLLCHKENQNEVIQLSLKKDGAKKYVEFTGITERRKWDAKGRGKWTYAVTPVSATVFESFSLAVDARHEYCIPHHIIPRQLTNAEAVIFYRLSTDRGQVKLFEQDI